MSLYGALSSGVSGLKSQANSIGIISDNISNVNTVGYKRGSGSFETLVTSSGTIAYSPGGVLGRNFKQISEQGLLVTTSNNTDIAISGKGMFVVNTAADSSGTVYYTRAGAFRQDATGNFQNAAGYFLQGWPLDRDGSIPTSSDSLTSLQTINVQSLTGVAGATTRIELSVNLDSTQVGYPGSGADTAMDINSVANYGIGSSEVIVPTSVNSLARGDQFVVETGNGQSYTYRYGGFTFGRDITNASAGDDGQALPQSPVTLGNNPFSTTPSSNTVSVRHSNHGFQSGDTVTFSGVTNPIGGIPAADFNSTFIVTVVDEDTYTIETESDAQAASVVPNATSMVSDNAPATGPAVITMTLPTGHGFTAGQRVTISGATGFDNILAAELNQTFTIDSVTTTSITFTIATIAGNPAGAVTGGGAAATATLASGGGTVVAASVRSYPGNIFDATTASTTFFGTTGTSGLTTNALSFTITTAETGTLTFTYVTGTPNAQLGQFNTLNNLADAISSFSGLSARVVNNRLYITALDANQAITFANGDDTGEGTGTALKSGVDWISELGLQNIIADSNRFSTLEGLADIINDSPGISAEVSNPDSEATLTMYVDDPLDTITFSDLPVATGNTVFGATESPVGTVSGSTTVTMTHTSAHGFAKGDIVTIDPTSISNYPTSTTALNAFTTTSGSNVVTIADAAHGFTTGDLISFDFSNVAGYPTGNINGIPLYEFQDIYAVTVTGAGTYTITVSSPATSTGTTGTGTFVASPTLNGIPLTDFNGQFELLSATSTSYTFTVAHAATATGSLVANGLIVEDPTNSGSVVAELGLVDSLNSGGFTVEQTTGELGPAYDASDADKNMASGNITPQYFTNTRIFDSLGDGHDLRTAFIKTGINTWAVEIFAVPDTDVSSSFADGQIAAGTIVFNGDGSLRSVESTLSQAITVSWENGAEASEITYDWGTAGPPANTDPVQAGLTDGMSQFSSAYRLNFANQNGVPVGELLGVEIDDEGIVTARFSNGESQQVFKIPVADFANFDGLDQVTGNVFSETTSSGTHNLREAGTSGTGTIQSSTLESSNAELSEQLTSMIVAQRSYQANTKVITTADRLLEELNSILR